MNTKQYSIDLYTGRWNCGCPNCCSDEWHEIEIMDNEQQKIVWSSQYVRATLYTDDDAETLQILSELSGLILNEENSELV